jgi:hypothetical protein
MFREVRISSEELKRSKRDKFWATNSGCRDLNDHAGKSKPRVSRRRTGKENPVQGQLPRHQGLSHPEPPSTRKKPLENIGNSAFDQWASSNRQAGNSDAWKTQLGYDFSVATRGTTQRQTRDPDIGDTKKQVLKSAAMRGQTD